MQKIPLRARLFETVLLCCFAFVFFSALAMVFYPGGTITNPQSRGYSFLLNFFSDLGRHRARNGAPNTFSAPLFALALTLAGWGLMLFFAAFAGLFQGGLWTRVVAFWGGGLGILAGACFVGVAATPSDLRNGAHSAFVLWAFRFFLGAVLTFALAIFRQRLYPYAAWLFVAFALFLASYLALITLGPRSRTPTGLMIQVTGQKLVVYASILCVGLQSLLARRFIRAKLIE